MNTEVYKNERWQRVAVTLEQTVPYIPVNRPRNEREAHRFMVNAVTNDWFPGTTAYTRWQQAQR